MSTKKDSRLGSLIAANPMAKYSDLAWSDAACKDGNDSANNLTIGFQKASNYLTAGELNLMSRFSLNTSLTLNTATTDSDTTSSSTSGSSTTNNSSSSLSLSPANNERDIDKFNNIKHNVKPAHLASNHLLELQKEIKEEEEEIFADINSLINGRSNLYSTFDVGDDDDDVDDGVNLDEESQSTTFNHLVAPSFTTTTSSHLQDFHNRRVEIDFNNSSDDQNDYQSQSADDANNLGLRSEFTGIKSNEESKYSEPIRHHHHHHHQYSHEHNSDYMPHDTSQYLDESDEQHQTLDQKGESSYYDEEQLFARACEQGANQQDYQSVNAVIQQVTSNLPKPCVFFLEGNCRRSDCKYSHDLSNITCKYWIEGFCFKGELCPFLHSYNLPNDATVQDDDGLHATLSKKDLNPTYVIESEADFPSLPLDALPTALNDASKSNINASIITASIKNQILSSNPAVVFKTVKKKRKRG